MLVIQRYHSTGPQYICDQHKKTTQHTEQSRTIDFHDKYSPAEEKPVCICWFSNQCDVPVWDGEGKSRRVAEHTAYLVREGVCVFVSEWVCVAESSAEVHLTGWEGDQDPHHPANRRVSQPLRRPSLRTQLSQRLDVCAADSP